jgi:hypothetical protein
MQRCCRLLGPGVAAVLTTHCADPIDAPSAFSAERYVCGPEHAAEFDALVEECRVLRQTSVCRGVLSFRGDIDSEDVTLDTRITSASIGDWPGGDPNFARTVSVLASSPYFSIKLDMNYLAVPPRRSVSGLLPDDCGSFEGLTVPCVIFNFEARGGNYFSALLNVERVMELEQYPDLRVSFSGDLGRGGRVEGCFHTFVP